MADIKARLDDVVAKVPSLTKDAMLPSLVALRDILSKEAPDGAVVHDQLRQLILSLRQAAAHDDVVDARTWAALAELEADQRLLAQAVDCEASDIRADVARADEAYLPAC